MYRKDSTGWIKHVDFIILDLICLQVAFVLAYALSGYGANPYQLILYRNMAVFMEVADLVVLFAMGTLKNVLKRGYYKDFVVTAQHGVILGACLLLYLFMLQEGQQYSRLALVLNIVIYILLTYLVRELWKHLLRKKMEDGENRSLLLVVSADVVSAVVESMKEHNYARYKIAGIAVIDKEMTGKYVNGVKVVANMENAAECDEKLEFYLEEIKKIEKCFSKNNPWIEMFSEMVIPEEITRPDVKRWIDRVESFRYEKIEVQFKNREWKEMLPEEWFEEA